tara:strand:+ start:2032 stop:2235 length:204 start_codon:yes stop_codon:yes gene_type:complete
MTLEIRVLQELEKDQGTCRQLQDRIGKIKLGTIRAIVCKLKREGIVVARSNLPKIGRENVWVVVERK